jgi:hypothetical protein
MDGEPRRLEYTNLRCMDPAVVNLQQLYIEQIHSVQSLADANRQVAVHSPAPT